MPALTLENRRATWCCMASVPRSRKASANSTFGAEVRGFTSRKRATTATAARALLGKDYVTLVDMIDVRSKGDDEDALGANVNEYFVHGIANTNAAIAMSRGDRLWIGMLVFDARNQVRMRYYTNVPAWKRRVSRTIQAWRDRIDSQLPIDLMR
ncbi:hypothetical protein [Burkholderia ubonensis]|uniref:hypothetical protein n=1 Tax=Burkholderia ubonensis TaxID=101571 RepID=UPI000A48B74A|nr:hypothetical protein [Burkholderia ubonensis]